MICRANGYGKRAENFGGSLNTYTSGVHVSKPENWLFWSAFAHNPGTKDWELVVVKISLKLDDLRDVALEDVLGQFGEGIGTMQIRGVSRNRAAELADQRLKQHNLPTVTSFMENRDKYRARMEDTITMYGCVPMDTAPETIRLQALAGAEY